MSRSVTSAVAILWGLFCAGGAVAAPDDSAMLSSGKKLFSGEATPPCAVCHTLADAGSAGAIGPNLDELRPSADRVEKALRSGIGVMPSYRATMKEEQIKAVARYVAKATGAAQ